MTRSSRYSLDTSYDPQNAILLGAVNMPNIKLPRLLAFLLGLTVVSSVFQAASLLAGPDVGFPLVPVVLSEFLFVIFMAAYLALKGRGLALSESKVTILYLLLFMTYASLSAFFFPHVFEGLLVFSPREGIDAQVGNETPLIPSISNVGQVMYLALNSFFMIGVLLLGPKLKQRSVLRMILLSGLVVAFFALYQKLGQLLNIWYPYDLLNSNSLYSQGYSQTLEGFQRISSTFTEPSYAGNVLGTFFVYYLYVAYFGVFRVRNWLLAGVFFLSTLLTTSTIGFAEVLFGLALMAALSLKNVKHVIYTIMLVLVVVWLSFYFQEIFVAALINKGGSLSAINRLSADERALELLVETYGFGVGLGGNRPSSFITYMLSNVGLIGSALFFVFIGSILSPAFRNYSFMSLEQKAIFWAVISLLVGKSLGAPDLNFWFFWAFLACAALVLKMPCLDCEDMFLHNLKKSVDC